MEDIIIVVDDEPAVLGYLSELLSINGYKVEAYRRAKDALDALIKQPDAYKLLITDQTMPGMLGVELIQKACEVKNMPTILCTGYSDKLDKTSACKLGVKEFLSKPFDTKILLNVVAETFAENS